MTTDKRSHHPLEGGSRISAYTFETSELTLITDTRDPLYDKRVEDPLSREYLLNIAASGVETAISVRQRGNECIVVRGKQRTKAVMVVNALTSGVAYKGSVKSVMSDIRTFGADEAFVKQLTLFTKGRAMKIRALPANSGDDRQARLSMRAENAHRHGDPTADRMRYVQEEIEKYGTSHLDLAIAEGVSVATIKRWANTDASAPRKPAKRGRATRPSSKKIAAFIETVNGTATPRERAIFAWVQSGGDETELQKLFG